MKVYLVSNNLLVEGLSYSFNVNLEKVRLIRPLSIEGENISHKIMETLYPLNIDKIYASFYSGTIATSKYLAQKLELDINLEEGLNDCKVGLLGSKNMQMVKGMQEHEFTYKLPNGESLVDVGNRLDNVIKNLNLENQNVAMFTHKRAILGLLLKYSKVGYNLDENLILEYNDQIIYDDSDTSYDIYELTLENNKIVNIKLLS